MERFAGMTVATIRREAFVTALGRVLKKWTAPLSRWLEGDNPKAFEAKIRRWLRATPVPWTDAALVELVALFKRAGADVVGISDSRLERTRLTRDVVGEPYPRPRLVVDVETANGAKYEIDLHRSKEVAKDMYGSQSDFHYVVVHRVSEMAKDREGWHGAPLSRHDHRSSWFQGEEN